MLRNKRKSIIRLQYLMLTFPTFVFLVVLVQLNAEVRADQVMLFVNSGGVEVKHQGGNKSDEFVSINSDYLTLSKNASIKTTSGSAFIMLPNKTLVSLDANSELSLDTRNPAQLKITTQYGRSWHRVDQVSSGNFVSYEVETPQTRLAATGSEFEINIGTVNMELQNEVALLSGEAVVANSQSRVAKTIDQGKKARVTEGDGGIDIREIAPYEKDSEFIRRNKEVGQSIEEIKPNAPVETYKQVIENVGLQLVSQVVDSPNTDGASDKQPAADQQKASVPASEPVTTHNNSQKKIEAATHSDPPSNNKNVAPNSTTPNNPSNNRNPKDKDGKGRSVTQ